MKRPLKINYIGDVNPLEIWMGSSEFQSCIKISPLVSLAEAWVVLAAHSVDKVTKSEQKGAKARFSLIISHSLLSQLKSGEL